MLSTELNRLRIENKVLHRENVEFIGDLAHTEAIVEDILRDSDNGKHFAAFIAMRARDRLVALVKFG